MSRVLILVEGPTERAVIQRIFAPYFGNKDIYLYPRIIGKPGHKGGNKFQIALNDIKMLLKQELNSFVTTFFDYYGLPDDWPGRIETTKFNNNTEKSKLIEDSLLQKVCNEMGSSFNSNRFIPYVQMHEIEALLFANPKIMAQVFDKPNLEKKLEEILNECGSCEEIDDSPLTAPSKRIGKLFPQYKKGSSVNSHAPRIIEKIGIDEIRIKCPHFNHWLTLLEKLSQR